MTREEIMQLNTDYLNGHESEHEMNELFNYVLELQKHEQEPCENCVSRQDVKEQMIKYGFHAPDMTVTEFVEDLPSVTPQQKVGKWIYDYTTADGHRTYHCSKCGCFLKPKHSEPLNSFKWCSLCGAKMEQESK